MSFEPVLWAMKHAPTADVVEYAVLITYAEYCRNAGGYNTYPTHPSVGARAHLDQKTVGKAVNRLVRRGLMARGDQRFVEHIPKNQRPVNYNLLIPAAWFSDLQSLNHELKESGLPPITHQSRPPIGSPPPRKRRADAKPLPVPPTPLFGEDYESPRTGLVVPSGGTESPVGGDLKSRPGGLRVPSEGTSSHPNNQQPSATNRTSSAVTVTVPGARVGDWEEDKDALAGVLTPAVREALDLLHRVPAPAGRRGMTYTEMLELVPLVVRCLGEPWPWSKIELLHELSRDLGDARNVAGVLLQRLTSQIDPLRLPEDGGLWPHERPARPAVAPPKVLCVECRAPFAGEAPADGLCSRCRADMARAVDAAVASDGARVDQIDLVDVDGHDQVPGQLGVPLADDLVEGTAEDPAG